MNHSVVIEKSLCIGCGLCIKDCPVGDIVLEDNIAQAKHQSCLFCGHCLAICPKGAISLTGFDSPPEPLTKEKIDSSLLLGHFKSRRSIRHFKMRPIGQDIIEQIIEAGRYSPTGKNVQDVSYIIIEKEKLALEKMAIKSLKRLIGFLGLFSKKLRGLSLDEGDLFKKAPLVLVIVSKSSVNGALAASNMALMAESFGLGVLYSGFFAVACKISKPLRIRLGLKKREKVVTALVLGYPDVFYQRTAPRERAKIKYI